MQCYQTVLSCNLVQRFLVFIGNLAKTLFHWKVMQEVNLQGWALSLEPARVSQWHTVLEKCLLCHMVHIVSCEPNVVMGHGRDMALGDESTF